MRISIIGLGWFGSALADALSQQHEISGTTRNPLKSMNLSSKTSIEQLDATTVPSNHLLNTNAVVLNIPPFANQLEWFKSWSWNLNTHLVFISSTSVYGDILGTVDENTTTHPVTENARILIEEENWAKTFPNCTIIRFGGLIGKDRHPGKYLSGKKNLAQGNCPVNLIHLEDCIDFTKLVLEKKLVNETFNLVSPKHPTRKAYYTDYCKKNNLPLPEFIDSEASSKIISHEKVSKIYQFRNA
jgi:nucleoside-diphosphate-sugar epimerase